MYSMNVKKKKNGRAVHSTKFPGWKKLPGMNFPQNKKYTFLKNI